MSTVAGPPQALGARSPWTVGTLERLASAVAVVLVLAAATVAAPDLWAAQVVALILLCLAPGLVALDAIGARVTPLAMPATIVAASMTVLMATGAVVNALGPLAGVEHPLRPVPLLLGLALVLGTLSVIAAHRGGPSPWRRLAELGIAPRRALIGASPLLLPLLAAAGAARLNAGHGPGAAIAAACAVVAAAAATFLAADRLPASRLALVLFCVGLALMWANALRGASVHGFDIHTELAVANETARTGLWPRDHRGDAYGAMLSITVLPALLSALSGVTPELLLRVLYPCVFALVPVAVLGLCGRFARPRIALAASGAIVAQVAFIQGFPALARQEIAALCFTALLVALLDEGLDRRPRNALVALMAAGMVVAHYSTTYITIAILAASLVGLLIAGGNRLAPGVAVTVAVALGVAGAGAAAWYGAVTHSSDGLNRVASDFERDGLRLLPSAEGRSLVAAYLNGNTPSPLPPREYEALAAAEFATRPYVRPLAAASAPRYGLTDAPATDSTTRSVALSAVYRAAHLIASQGLNVLALAAVAILLWQRRRHAQTLLLAMVCLAFCGLLAIFRLSGTAAIAYNQERLLLQALIPLAVAMAIAVEAGRRWRLTARLGTGMAGAVGVLLLGGTGLATAALGGSRPSSLSNTGEAADRFLVHEPERASARWLRANLPFDEVAYADRYGVLRLVQVGGGVSRRSFQDLTPRTIDRDAWVYSSRVNLAGRARGAIDGRISVYAFPSRFLDDWLDTVYSNGSSEVHHRSRS